MPKRSGRGSAALNRTAAQLGRVLGTVAARVESLARQRTALRAELQSVIDGATAMMRDLGDTARTAGRAGRRAAASAAASTRSAVAGRKGRRKKRTFSPEARARMAEAARRRWAKVRKTRG